MPYASRICSIFPLWMESKALVKSTNINVACRFYARTPSRILRMVNICEVVDLFLTQTSTEKHKHTHTFIHIYIHTNTWILKYIFVHKFCIYIGRSKICKPYSEKAKGKQFCRGSTKSFPINPEKLIQIF